jgi:hypothetical protein
MLYRETFRTTNEPLKSGNGTPPATTGLSDLHASGSGEFTAHNLKLLLTRMLGPVTIFDLRQETHVFVNGLPVSWFATRDWANVGRSQTEIEEEEAAYCGGSIDDEDRLCDPYRSALDCSRFAEHKRK